MKRMSKSYGIDGVMMPNMILISEKNIHSDHMYPVTLHLVTMHLVTMYPVTMHPVTMHPVTMHPVTM